MILTRQQRTALHRVYQRTLENPGKQPLTYRQFRRKVEAGFDCIMVPFANMWLGIERDGYTHS